jgi:hypothetical protein
MSDDNFTNDLDNELEKFRAKKAKEAEDQPQVSGIHPERAANIADQINHGRVQTSETNAFKRSQSGLNEQIAYFRKSRKFKGYGIRTKVKRFDAETAVVQARITDKDGHVVSEAHASWDADLIYSAVFASCSKEEVESYRSLSNRDRLELCQNIAISRALRFLNI